MKEKIKEIDWTKPAVELVEELQEKFDNLDTYNQRFDFRHNSWSCSLVAIELALSVCPETLVEINMESEIDFEDPNPQYSKLQEMKQIVLSKINQ